MKKISILVGIIAFLIALPVTLMANSTKCATKYPIVLAHGMAFEATTAGIIDYWGTIPSTLKNNGAHVYVTSVNAMDSTVDKANQWKAQVLQILAVSGKGKVNVIGHSHGAIYTRYAITNLGMASNVASLTSICGPHRGSVIADMVMGIIPNSLKPAAGAALNILFELVMGDSNSNSMANLHDLERSYMINVFNPGTPDMDYPPYSIYYQSYAYKITNPLGSGALLATWLAMIPYEGDNDGLVSTTSAQWGKFKGVITGIPLFGGINHLAAVGLLSLPTPGYDAPSFFTSVVADLKSKKGC